MANLLLLCHGAVLESGTAFTVPPESTVELRGTFGAALSDQVANVIIAALLADPTIDDRTLQRQLPGYDPQAPIDGPATHPPDFLLTGNDNPPAFLMDLGTRAYTPLPRGWSTRLSRLLPQLPTPFWLNLLCCTNVRGSGVPAPGVRFGLEQNWQNFVRGLHPVG